MSDLSERIDRLLETLEPRPERLVAPLKATLTKREQMALIDWALQEKIRERIRQRRLTQNDPEELERQGGRIIWPPDDELRGLVDGDFTSAAKRLGVSRAVLRKYCLSRGIEDHFAHLENEMQAEFMNELSHLCETLTDQFRQEGVHIGLAQANVERVQINGEWKLLGDCTSNDLRILAQQYQTGAGANLKAGAFYLAVAEEMEEGHYQTVREMAS